MTTLKFADTHNMVAFLSKLTESDGFEQIVDFLNAQPIRYTLTVNPTIYISCIEQFWSTGVVKTINGEVQLHALVDGKKIIISEASVRRDLKLEDEEGIDCLPNSTIFEQLALMGYEKISQKLTFYKPFFSPQWKFLIHTILQCLSPKTTAWNEFSSTMASAIICLATNQKFNFSKFIFEGMIRNLDNVSGKFLMYPRFVQVFLNQQLDGLPTHKRIYNAPSHTKKIFGNIRRVGKGFSGRVTPLFPTMVVQNQAELGEGSAIPTDPHHTPTIIESSSQPQKTQKPRKPKRKDTQVPQPSDPSDNVADEVVHKELGDSLVRAATTASSLEAEQDNGNITKTRSKATPNESSSLGTTSGGGPRCQETMGDTIAQTRFENVSKLSNMSTARQEKVLDLEKTKTTQANEIASLKRRVKKLEKKRSSRTHKLKRLYKVGLSARVESSGDEEDLGEDASKQGRINAIDANEDIILVNVQDDANKEMFDMDALNSEEATTTVTITTEEITLAQALKALKTSKPKVKGIIFQEPDVDVDNLRGVVLLILLMLGISFKFDISGLLPHVITTIAYRIRDKDTSQSKQNLQSSSMTFIHKTLIIPSVLDSCFISSTVSEVKRYSTNMRRTDADFSHAPPNEYSPSPDDKKQWSLVWFDFYKIPITSKRQEYPELEYQVFKTRRTQKTTSALEAALEDLFKLLEKNCAKIEADHELAQRLQAEEQEELSDAEKATLFQQLLEKRRKHFAAKRAEEQRKKPPTQAQQRKIMCTYLKNMEGKKLKDLKNKSFDSIKKMFDRAFKRVNTFVDFRTELVEGKEKRAEEELIQESSKKQKVDDDMRK
ncbi:hypothetical protein Tco_0818897 [Tanacetum coccineum]